MSRNLKDMRSKNPEDYWKILNQGRKRTQLDIRIDTLYDIFQGLEQ